mgnify:CR=1 FL=1
MITGRFSLPPISHRRFPLAVTAPPTAAAFLSPQPSTTAPFPAVSLQKSAVPQSDSKTHMLRNRLACRYKSSTSAPAIIPIHSDTAISQCFGPFMFFLASTHSIPLPQLYILVELVAFRAHGRDRGGAPCAASLTIALVSLLKLRLPLVPKLALSFPLSFCGSFFPISFSRSFPFDSFAPSRLVYSFLHVFQDRSFLLSSQQ